MNSGFAQTDPFGQIFADKGVRIVRPFKDFLQCRQLVAGEGGPIPARFLTAGRHRSRRRSQMVLVVGRWRRRRWWRTAALFQRFATVNFRFIFFLSRFVGEEKYRKMDQLPFMFCFCLFFLKFYRRFCLSCETTPLNRRGRTHSDRDDSLTVTDAMRKDWRYRRCWTSSPFDGAGWDGWRRTASECRRRRPPLPPPLLPLCSCRKARTIGIRMRAVVARPPAAADDEIRQSKVGNSHSLAAVGAAVVRLVVGGSRCWRRSSWRNRHSCCCWCWCCCCSLCRNGRVCHSSSLRVGTTSSEC